MVRIGTIMGARYEILERVGTGGMSDVYKAKDIKLNRFVAVKVLKQEFGENGSFVSKFHTEAQAAASLAHPNIVNVYDVGQDEETQSHYIVMELVEGITLKKYIEKKARLSVKEAISIAVQACNGIEAAHRKHIIHRDIKPQNIIISKDGKVKVTDFGIAKAATSETITANVMGSVHYASPEQARGGYSDEKSDIYSMGITLFEMLTGRLPFTGDTTVTIAIKQIQDPMPSPRIYVPEIPVSVEQIVLKCTQKSPDRRYQDMASLIRDLKQSLITPDEDFVHIADMDELSHTRQFTEEELEDFRNNGKHAIHVQREKIRRNQEQETSGEDRHSRTSSSRGSRGYGTQGSRKKSGTQDPEDLQGSGSRGRDGRSDTKRPSRNTRYEEDPDDEEDSGMEGITAVLAVAGAVLIGIIVIVLVGRTMGIFGGDDVETVQMIDVVGYTQEEAETALTALGLDTDVLYEVSDTVEEGIVIDTDVAAGTSLEAGDTVTLTVSGSSGVAIPDVTGLSLAEAVANLESAGFASEKMEGYSDSVAEGYIMSQSPEAGSKAELGSTVTIIVSQGAQESLVSVPDVLGMLPADAQTTLEAAGLTVRNVEEVYYDDEAFLGRVCYQSYSVGTQVESGTAIDLQVSLGPEVTYMYMANIESPAVEDSEYVTGTSCVIVLTTASGKEIYRMSTTTFPVAVNLLDINEATGVLTLIYSVTSDTTSVTDEETGEVTLIPGTTEERTVSREVTFIKVE